MATNYASLASDLSGGSASAPGAQVVRQIRLIIGASTFWILFAGYFFYHFLVARGLIFPVLGGLFGPVLAASLPFTLWGAYLASRRLPAVFSNGIAITVILLFSWSIFWLAVHFADDPANSAHPQLALAITFWLGILALSFNIPVFSPLFEKVLLASLGVMGLLALAFIDASTLMTETVLDKEASSYQGLARGLMIVGTFVLCAQRNIFFRIGVALFTLAALFVVGARSELYGFIAGYGAVEAIINRRSLFAQFLLAGLAIVTVWLILQNLDFLAASRQLQIFDLSQSSSWVARQYMFENAQKQVLESPLFGIYGGHWILGEGDYAHNALSAWVSLGFPGFFFYVFACLLSVAISLNGLVRDTTSRLAKLALLINVSNLLLIAVAKPMFWEMPALGWGLAILVVQELRLADRRIMTAR